jgi:hypothetical protein
MNDKKLDEILKRLDNVSVQVGDLHADVEEIKRNMVTNERLKLVYDRLGEIQVLSSAGFEVVSENLRDLGAVLLDTRDKLTAGQEPRRDNPTQTPKRPRKR